MPGTHVADAYVSVIPETSGFGSKLQSAMNKDAGGAGNSAGSIFGGGLVKKVIGIVAAAKIGEKIVGTISDSINAGGALQQSIGGIEALYGTASQRMIQYANQAYKTVGISANDYMQQATSFSASLITSLGGDTMKAAEIANMAMVDMGDNVNRFGNEMESVQNAYQGLAKGEYRMLDNLKLGYKGTAEGMQSLIKHANELKKANGETGDLSIESFADMVEAIHLVQEELNVTGTTSKEAATTLEGSANAMKAAWQNVLANMSLGSDGSESLKVSMSHLATSASTYLFDNLLPMIGQVISNLPSAMGTFFQAAWPKVKKHGSELLKQLVDGFTGGTGDIGGTISGLIDKFIEWIRNDFPQLVTNGTEALQEWISGWGQGDGEFASTAIEIIVKLIKAFAEASVQLVIAGGQIIDAITQGLINAAPQIWEKIKEICGELVSTIGAESAEYVAKGKEMIEKLKEGISGAVNTATEAVKDVLRQIKERITEYGQEMLNSGQDLIDKLSSGISNAITKVIEAIGTIIDKIKSLFDTEKWADLGTDLITKISDAIKAAIEKIKSAAQDVIDGAKGKFNDTDWSSLGTNIINGIVSGISGAAGNLYNKLKSLAQSALSAAKNELDINSPSKVFRDQVGRWIPEGIAVGIEANADSVTDAMARISNATVQASAAVVSSTPYGEVSTTNATQVGEVLGVLSKYLPELGNTKIMLREREVGRVIRQYA